MSVETSKGEQIKARVHKSWFSVAVGQIVISPHIQLGRPSPGERLFSRFPGKCCMELQRAAEDQSTEKLDFAAKHGSLGNDEKGHLQQRHWLLNHTVWAGMMLYIGWFFLAWLLPAWRWASPSRHMELLFITLVTLGCALRFHRVLFTTQIVAKRAVLVTAISDRQAVQ